MNIISCIYIRDMSLYFTKYRKEHPENYKHKRIKDNERVKNIYHTNPEFKEKVKHQALARNYRLKNKN